MQIETFQAEVYKRKICWQFWPDQMYYFNTVGYIEWRITPLFIFDKSGARKNISLEVECRYYYQSSNLWEINTEIEVFMINKDGNEVSKKQELCFDKHSKLLTVDEIMEARDFEKDNGEMAKESVLIRTHIRMKSTVGIQVKKMSEFSEPLNIDSEVVVHVGTRKFYVDKYALFNSSSVFRKIFEDSNEMEIDDVPYYNVVDFLRLVCKRKQSIDPRNVGDVLKLAERYDILFLLSDCEDFLVSTHVFIDGSKLHFAELHNLSQLQIKVLNELTTDRMEKVIKWSKMGPRTIEALFLKVCRCPFCSSNF